MVNVMTETDAHLINPIERRLKKVLRNGKPWAGLYAVTLTSALLNKDYSRKGWKFPSL